MASKLSIRFAALAALVIGIGGMTTAAKADIGFTNVTDETLVFNLQCPRGSVDTWQIYPHRHLNIYCTNRADAAAISIRTRHPDGRAFVVRGTVFDGRNYEMAFDDDGDVSIAPVAYGAYY